MRLVIVNDVYHPDDATPDAALNRFTTLTGWANALRAQGADVLVCQRFCRDGRVSREGVDYQFFADADQPKPRASFAGNPDLHRAVSSFATPLPAVVHVNGLDYPRAIQRLRRAVSPNVAIAVQDHGGFDPDTLSVVRRLWLRRGLSAATVLLVATAAQASAFRRSGLVPDRVAIHDVMESSTDFRAAAGGRTGTRLAVLCVGRLNANKDPLTVLEGFARFAATHPQATLTFVYGTSDLEAALRAAVQRTAIAPRVTLAGAVPHAALESVYAAADIFVLGSRREGSGYAALEAMACGVVPVLTNIPAFRGLTDDGRVGALWEPGVPTSLAAALARVADAPLDPQRERCRRRFEERFSWTAIGLRAADIYRECSAR